MIDQMRKRLSNKPNSSSYPIWAWYQFENSKKKKPDLRYKIAGERGEEFVLLEINKDDTEVLLSDFDLWHFPLSYQSYIGDSEQDTLLFEQELTNLGFDSKLNDELPPFYANKIIDSWNKIFDLTTKNLISHILKIRNQSKQRSGNLAYLKLFQSDILFLNK